MSAKPYVGISSLTHIRGWVPVRVEEDEPVATDEVEAASAGTRGQQEDELVACRVIELVNQLLPLAS